MTGLVCILSLLLVGAIAAPFDDDYLEFPVEQTPMKHPNELGYILMDDMWFNNDTMLRQSKKGVTKWEGGRLPYEFESSYPANARTQVQAGIKRWNEVLGSCISIVPKTSRDKYYVRIHNSDGCTAVVGRQSQGGQWMSLNANGCTSKGPTMHEFMHSVGFEHEHQRPDRGNAITVHFENITPEWRRWWEIEKNMDIISPFNCESLMMYPAISGSYSINNKPAFSANSGHSCTGDYHHDFAQTDIASIKKLYNCR